VAKTAVKKSEMELKVDLLQMMIPGEFYMYIFICMYMDLYGCIWT
jgi:hypothetical protein